MNLTLDNLTYEHVMLLLFPASGDFEDLDDFLEDADLVQVPLQRFYPIDAPQERKPTEQPSRAHGHT